MSKQTPAHKACAYIQEKHPNFKPVLGIVLGSGLGNFADYITDAISIPYSELPGFPQPSVKGHDGQMILGTLNNTPVVCLKGRAHGYEGDNSEAVKTYVRTLKLLGCDIFLATNAAGSLREEAGPGSLMLITDHINFQPGNPLVGPNDDEFGPRFQPLDDAYDPALREMLHGAANNHHVKLHEGVYISVLGPSYETAAEIRAFATLGADAVGMSTVPEVIVARHCGLRVAVISIITNHATGLSKTSHDHNEVVATAAKAADELATTIQAFCGMLANGK